MDKGDGSIRKMDTRDCKCSKEHTFDLEMCPALQQRIDHVICREGSLPVLAAGPPDVLTTYGDRLLEVKSSPGLNHLLPKQSGCTSCYLLSGSFVKLLWTLQVESLLAMFVRCKDARQDLPVMPKTQRKIVHELAAAYGLTTQSYGQEPSRNLRVFRVSLSSSTLSLRAVMTLLSVMKHCQHLLS